jgi:hypothetical protein
VISLKPQPRCTPRERTPVPIGQEAGRTSELAWTQRLEEKSFASAEDRTPVELHLHSFLTSVLDGSGELHVLGALPQGTECPGVAHWMHSKAGVIL